MSQTFGNRSSLPPKQKGSRSSTPMGRNGMIKSDSRSQLFSNMTQDGEVDEFCHEELDPRVQDELEKLNSCTDEINQLENELEDANCLFRVLLTDSTQQLKSVAKKIGSSVIEKARPFFEAQEAAKKAQKECQAAATAYQRAFGVHAAAKETILLAEQRFLSNSNTWDFDNAWQEMLNHATIKVMEAEKQKSDSEAEHLQRAASFQAAEQEVQRLQKKLQRQVQASQPYFEQKDIFNKALESQKKRVQDLQEKVSRAKEQYAKSLRNLEDISESIHARRKLRHLWSHPSISDREPGVGAELEFDLDICDRASSRSTTSGKSASKAGSECDSVEVLPAKFDDGMIKLADLVDQFKFPSNDDRKPKPPTSMSAMTRTSSTPALNQLRQHMMSEPAIMSVTHTLDFDGKIEDSSVVGINAAADSKIEL